MFLYSVHAFILAPALSVDYDGGKVTMILKSDGKEGIFDP